MDTYAPREAWILEKMGYQTSKPIIINAEFWLRYFILSKVFKNHESGLYLSYILGRSPLMQLYWASKNICNPS